MRNYLLYLLVLVTFSLYFSVSEADHNSVTLSLQLYYPASSNPQKIFLRGNIAGLNWNSGLAFQYMGNNMWQYDLTYNVADFSGKLLQFKPLIDDKDWSIGANFGISLPEDNTYIQFYPWFYSQKGSYEVLPQEIYSPQLNNTRQLVIYTPPSYFENTLKTIKNVLVMHDGENLFNASTSFGGVAWDCQDTIDALVVEGTIDEVLIVGVYNTPDRINEYTYSYAKDCGCPLGGGGQGDQYLDFLYDQVVPFVDNEYRIETGVENLAMLGSSLGGLISCYAGWTRPTIWGKVGCMSSSFWWNNEDFTNVIMNTSIPQYPLTVYLDSGTSGEGNDDMTQTITVRNHMENLGFEINRDLFYYLDEGGQHNEYYWGRRFHVPMSDFYPTKNLNPQ